MTEDIGKKRIRRAAGATVGAGSPAVPIAPEYPVRSKDKVAIVGFADGHRHLAPFDNPEFEIWGLNRLHAALPGRYDRWLEIHDIGMYLGDKGQPVDTEHLEFLRSFAGPVYLRPQDMGRVMCPSAVPFPVASALRDFGSYFTNSVSYMLALGIAMQFKEIHLYGVDMAVDQLFTAEYRQQRPSCEYFMGIAIGRGIKIYKPPGSDLLIADHLYGLEDDTPIMLKRLARMEELGKRKEGIRSQLAQLDAQRASMESQYWAQKINLVAAINQQDGAQQQIQYEMVNLSSTPVQEPPTKLR